MCLCTYDFCPLPAREPFDGAGSLHCSNCSIGAKFDLFSHSHEGLENPNAPRAESFSDVEARYPYWKSVTAYCNFAYLLLWEVIYIGLCINFFRSVLFGSSNSQLGISFTSIILIPAVSGVALFLAFQFCVHVMELVDYAILERHFTFQSAWDAPTLAIEAGSIQVIPREEPDAREQKGRNK